MLTFSLHDPDLGGEAQVGAVETQEDQRRLVEHRGRLGRTVQQQEARDAVERESMHFLSGLRCSIPSSEALTSTCALLHVQRFLTRSIERVAIPSALLSDLCSFM